MFALVDPSPSESALPLVPLTKAGLEPWLAGRDAAMRAFVEGAGFAAEPGATLFVPGADGPAAVLFGVGESPDLWAFGALPASLPARRYRLEESLDRAAATRAMIGWGLGAYRFTRYKAAERKPALLEWHPEADRAHAESVVTATFLVRDLINTPASDMGPEELAYAAAQLAAEFEAKIRVVVDENLIHENFPMIHAVGRASSRAPRLIDIRWGDPEAPKVTLVGKGVCFDSGGLDIKPAEGMKLMKKDMGGAANVLGLARMIMAANLPVRLRVLVPAVENSVSGNAFRPMDILPTRKGLSVEIGNTDAEGRLVLCDALAEGDDEQPALLVDLATLTGAARVALGPDLPALFCNDDALADELMACGRDQDDPLWRLPLWPGYKAMLKSKIADLNNAPGGPFGGAITAALYLEHFVAKTTKWIHIDLFAWNNTTRPGRPEGGEAMTIRALYALIAKRFGGKAA
ncbi:MAG TPA: leucyl aminopeptidase family protein [Alphaproteobacteria bacterium]|nr:leucyl aminopeptidase family protein [Alphaproteobacteria bacterium]